MSPRPESTVTLCPTADHSGGGMWTRAGSLTGPFLAGAVLCVVLAGCGPASVDTQGAPEGEAAAPAGELTVNQALDQLGADDPAAVAAAAEEGMGGASLPAQDWLADLMEERTDYTGVDVLEAAAQLSVVETYTLESGDTATKVAEDHGLTVETILSYNRIESPRTLRPGQELRVPSRDGILLDLEETDITELAGQYGVSPELVRLANNLEAGAQTLSGEVFIPGARMDPRELRKLLGEYFAWPMSGGRVTSRFGWRNDPFTGARSFHTGVDIATWHGAPVTAAGEGRVLATGFDRVLGNFIRVDQGQGFVVVYGHLSAIGTKQGAWVKAGQTIGKVGSTGYSTGPHLHFGVYRWGRLLNPMMLFE